MVKEKKPVKKEVSIGRSRTATLEEDVADAPSLTPPNLPAESPVLYMPRPDEMKQVSRDAKNYWGKRFLEPYMPHRTTDYLALAGAIATGPTGMAAYAAWKMPVETHEKVSTVLNYATSLLGTGGTAAAIIPGAEEAAPFLYAGALATMLGNAVNHVVCGLKEKSGPRVIKGLEGVAASAEKIAKTAQNEDTRNRALATEAHARSALLQFHEKAKGTAIPAFPGAKTRTVSLN